MVTKNSYCIVFDTVIENLPKVYGRNRSWGKNDNPKSALKKYLNKIKSNKLSREINNISLEYYGTNYADNFLRGFKKVVLYSKSSIHVESDNKPIYYLVFALLGILSIIIDMFYSFILLYVFIRGFFVPMYKSNTACLLKEIKLILILPLTAIVYDMARMRGYLESYILK